MSNDELTYFDSFFRVLHNATGDCPPNILLLFGALSAESKGAGLNKGRYTRGSLLPQHAPATRSWSKATSCAPTIPSKKICCATKLFAP